MMKNLLNWTNTLKIRLSILFLLVLGGLGAQSTELSSLMDSLLKTNTEYQKALSRYESKKAVSLIERSLTWFDINFIYKQYENRFSRDEIEDDTEHSRVLERDKRWRIELDKNLFPKDYDHVSDAIETKLALLRYKQELKIAYTENAFLILDELILWYEAESMAKLLQSRLDAMYQQQEILEELDAKNLIDTDLLIENLELIDDKEQSLNEYQKLALIYNRKYPDMLLPFTEAMLKYISEAPPPDTLAFCQQIERERDALNKESGKLSKKIKASYLHYFMPELDLTLSYNWRETRQDWDIEKSGISKTSDRNQDEAFPEGEIRLSLPFDLYSAAKGKRSLLKAYERELDYQAGDLLYAWQKLSMNRIHSYYRAIETLSRKTRLLQLYNKELSQSLERLETETDLKSGNQETKLRQLSLKAAEAELKLTIAKMKLYKEVFLINTLGQDLK